ncbi:MAG: hypothetical protein HZC41_20260 [Chloroflexi bacterium]|nr:hypothetical protein [Chloroflexota bacterium]
MSNSPLKRSSLSRASVAGAALAVVGIILFIVLWVVMGQLGATNLARLLVALCLPPVVIAAMIGAYVLITRSRNGG